MLSLWILITFLTGLLALSCWSWKTSPILARWARMHLLVFLLISSSVSLKMSSPSGIGIYFWVEYMSGILFLCDLIIGAKKIAKRILQLTVNCNWSFDLFLKVPFNRFILDTLPYCYIKYCYFKRWFNRPIYTKDSYYANRRF